jgi:hypothetical protein
LTPLFSTKEAAVLAQAAVRNVDYWCRIGIATAIVPAAGTGSERKYSIEDVIVLAALADIAASSTVAVRRTIAARLRTLDVLTVNRVEIELSPWLRVIISLDRIRERLREETRAA